MDEGTNLAINVRDETQERAITEVLRERDDQDEQWGISDHAPELWLPILMRQIGHYSGAMLDVPGDPRSTGIEVRARLRNQAVHVAAVALAMVECHIRDSWWGDGQPV